MHAGEMDAFQALKLLEDHPRVDATRLGITGLSRGGIASYQATERKFVEAVLGADRYFKASLPMAIDCYMRFEQPLMTPTKTLFLLGSDDDYTPPEGCINWVNDVKATQGDEVDVEVLVLPGGDSPATQPLFSFCFKRFKKTSTQSACFGRSMSEPMTFKYSKPSAMACLPKSFHMCVTLPL